MSSSETSLIISLNETQVCGICNQIFVKPVLTPCCHHIYCRACVTRWLKIKRCPPNPNNSCEQRISHVIDIRNVESLKVSNRTKNILNNLNVRCDYYANGCKEKLWLCQLKRHIDSCRFNGRNICDVCDELNCDKNFAKCVARLSSKFKSLMSKCSKLESNNDRLKLENKRLVVKCNDLMRTIQYQRQKLQAKSIKESAVEKSFKKRNRMKRKNVVYHEIYDNRKRNRNKNRNFVIRDGVFYNKTRDKPNYGPRYEAITDSNNKAVHKTEIKQTITLIKRSEQLEINSAMTAKGNDWKNKQQYNLPKYPASTKKANKKTEPETLNSGKFSKRNRKKKQRDNGQQSTNTDMKADFKNKNSEIGEQLEIKTDRKKNKQRYRSLDNFFESKDKNMSAKKKKDP